MLNYLLSVIKPEWHISWRATIPDGRHIYGDGIYRIQPRLNLPKLREYAAEQASGASGFRVEPSQIFIVNMTRIGR